MSILDLSSIQKLVNKIEKGPQYCSDYITDGKGNVIKLFVKNKTDSYLTLTNKFNDEDIIYYTINSIVKSPMVEINDIVYCFKSKLITDTYSRCNNGCFFKPNYNSKIKEAQLILIPNNKEYKISPKNIKQINIFDQFLDVSLKMTNHLDNLEKEINKIDHDFINLLITLKELKKKMTI